MQLTDKVRVEALAHRAIQENFPEELALFPVTASSYFSDPKRAVKAAKSETKDEMLGFGVDMAVAVPMVTTAALWVAQEVLTWVGSQLRTSIEEESAGLIRTWVRRVLRLVGIESGNRPDEGTLPPLSTDQLANVRELALRRALDLLPESQARAIADSIVAGLVLPATEK